MADAPEMRIGNPVWDTQVHPDAETVARAAARRIAEAARTAARNRGRFVLGVSGGRTPWIMLRVLAAEDLPWNAVHVVQVDERLAPDRHPDRNLTQLQQSFLDRAPVPPDNVHAMPVTAADPVAAAALYATTLAEIAGSPPVLDLVQLGLGADGHTASLVPGDPVLDMTGSDVAVTGLYQGTRRMTLTFPALNRARQVMFVITGADKAAAVKRLLQRDPSIPASRIRCPVQVFVDEAALAGV